MLNLPANFKNDIQGRDTALVPVVVIGENQYLSGMINGEFFAISTNVINIPVYIPDHAGVDTTTKPLLLNIPSLKESIDIEKRNYKISSINLDISNAPYNGNRFSELIDGSLINQPCRVFWVSQTTTQLWFVDAYDDPATLIEDYPSAAFQVYSGTIRRYTVQGNEKVRLVVEDLSQATLHKDLPLEKNYLETGDPVPMVYGHVERSPVVPYYANIVEGTENVTEFQLIADNKEITENGFNESSQTVGGGATIPISALYFFDNNQYWNVARLDDDGNVNFNYSIESTGSIIRLDIDTVVGGESDTIISNDFSRGRLGIYTIRQIERVSSFHQGISGGVANTEFSTIGMGRLTGTIDVAVEDGDDYSATGMFLYLDDVNVPTKLSVDDDGDEVAPITEMYLSLTHYNFQTSIPSGGSANAGGNGDEYTNWRLWQQGQGVNSSGVTISTDDQSPSPWSYNFDSIDGSDNPRDISDDFGALNSKAYVIIGIPKHIHGGSGTPSDYSIQVDFTLHKAFLVHRFFVDGVLDKDYYANVVGRESVIVAGYGTGGGEISPDTYKSPKASVVIAHILETELGQTGIETDTTYDWEYAFTVDKKINSKKLIEGIASASPHIPRFNNMGEFKIDTIPYGNNGITTNPDETPSENHTIKEDDVIDFSFSRTKIEDVYTKIIFRYNWDYARGEFNDSVTVNPIDDFGYTDDNEDALDIFSYYGLPNLHEQSTLTIDDDRGKYIRNHDTAEDFAGWYLMWSLNQHLKMKVKLPLKYMNLEIGDFIEFDAILGGVKPYGIDYTNQGTERVNFQEVFPIFLITSTNKTLEWVEVECIQMHNLDEARLGGCADPTACNYSDHAVFSTNCIFEPDCNGDCGGSAAVDCNGDCCGGNTEVECASPDCGCGCGEACVDSDSDGVLDCDDECVGTLDCFGVCNGGAVYDECGVCEGDNSACEDCAGVPNGNSDINECGVCGWDEFCEQDCNDEWHQSPSDMAVVDECGVCGGDGSSCFDLADCPDMVTLWGVDYDVATTTSLDLSNQSLVGEIPLQIGCLTNLTSLNLKSNDLVGEIPSTIGGLINLKTLRLDYNDLSGSIPSSIGNLTDLEALRLNGNSLSGEIPSEIGNLTNLTMLVLQQNQLSGEIPSSIGNLINVTYLDLQINQLSGEIPPSICNVADSHPSVRVNRLCPQYFGTENEAYPSCLSESDIGDQDTSDCEEFVATGDVNNDGSSDVLDVIALVNCIVDPDDTGIPAEELCPPSGDMTGDGFIDIMDVVSLVGCIMESTCGE